MARRLLDAGYTAGANLIKNRVVALVDGLVYHYYPLNELHHGKIIGFSKEDYASGSSMIVIRDGYIDIPPLVQGDIYYAYHYGLITNVIPTIQPIVKVGIAKNDTELVIQFSDTTMSGIDDGNHYFP